MKRRCKVNNKDIVNSLKESLSMNENALDYIQNQIYTTKNILGYKPDSEEYIDKLNTLKFIKFQLEFINDQYIRTLRNFGVLL